MPSLQTNSTRTGPHGDARGRAAGWVNRVARDEKKKKPESWARLKGEPSRLYDYAFEYFKVGPGRTIDKLLAVSIQLAELRHSRAVVRHPFWIQQIICGPSCGRSRSVR